MSAAERLRGAIHHARTENRCITVPACHDALSAVLIQRAGFKIAFMSGFAVSVTQVAMPDAGLISYGEMLAVGQKICEATHGKLLVIGDGDTGFGSSGNIRRTMRGYALAGFAGISIEDQVYPKRCSYAQGLAVEPRTAAIARIRAALAARDEMRAEGLDLVLVARSDCRHAERGGLAEAIERCRAFAALGADVVYAEGLAKEELQQLSQALPPEIPRMLAQVERGEALLSAEELAQEGFSLNLLGLTLLNVAMKAMKSALQQLAAGQHCPDGARLPFEQLYAEAGFEDHYHWEARFADCPAER
ncbi:2 [Durusdinium trenchii]|uniref:2 n=1 Tax=Durusdinium trenchii TaxID=1381693 RepID=A0ABP0KBH4_9DINO